MLGAEPLHNSPEQLAVFLKADLGKWAKVVRDSGAKIESVRLNVSLRQAWTSGALPHSFVIVIVLGCEFVKSEVAVEVVEIEAYSVRLQVKPFK